MTQDLPDQTLPDQTLVDRFEAIARAKLDAVQESYGRIGIVPGETGDKALTQRHVLFKTMLTHIALLRKMLGLDRSPRAAAAGTETKTYEVAELDAMLSEVREARDD
jgi:hypothetical protein